MRRALQEYERRLMEKDESISYLSRVLDTLKTQLDQAHADMKHAEVRGWM